MCMQQEMCALHNGITALSCGYRLCVNVVLCVDLLCPDEIVESSKANGSICCSSNDSPFRYSFSFPLYFSLAGSSVTQDFCFELFSHVTKFFGYKVTIACILLPLLFLFTGGTVRTIQCSGIR